MGNGVQQEVMVMTGNPRLRIRFVTTGGSDSGAFYIKCSALKDNETVHVGNLINTDWTFASAFANRVTYVSPWSMTGTIEAGDTVEVECKKHTSDSRNFYITDVWITRS